MDLTISERLTLLMIIPQEGSYSKLKLLRTLKEELSFSEEEHKQYSIQDMGTRVTWNLQNSEGYVKDIPIGEVMFDVIYKVLQSLDQQEKLLETQVSLYEKFVV